MGHGRPSGHVYVNRVRARNRIRRKREVGARVQVSHAVRATLTCQRLRTASWPIAFISPSTLANAGDDEGAAELGAIKSLDVHGAARAWRAISVDMGGGSRFGVLVPEIRRSALVARVHRRGSAGFLFPGVAGSRSPLCCRYPPTAVRTLSLRGFGSATGRGNKQGTSSSGNQRQRVANQSAPNRRKSGRPALLATMRGQAR